MTKMARAVVVQGQEFEVREYAVPDPAPGAVVLKQELAGICGTDLHYWQHGFREEKILGHENVGIVAALGAGVTHDSLGRPVKEGDRVVLQPGIPAGFGYGFQAPPGLYGGFAEYIHLDLPGTEWWRTEMPAEIGVLTEPFTIGVHAVDRARMHIGDTVVVQGSGAIGLVTLIAAKLSGAGKIIMVGGPAERLALGRRFGADVTIDIEEVPTVEERTELVMAETPRGQGADVVFECAGFLAATPEGLGYCRQSGTFVEVGHFVDMGSIDFNINRLLMRKNLSLEAIWGSYTPHFVQALPILEKGEIPFGDMVSHVLPLERVADGFAALNGTYHLGDETVCKIAVSGDV